ncbi:MAG: glycosyltransferase family 4 protein [Candidatus Woesearchaeota archaeon]|nr:glycosyltransferase family 4 protein [Candidatus Woesearchaeota archaeon]
MKQGHEVTVLTHKLPGTAKEEIIDGAQVYRVACFDSRYLFTFFGIPKALSLAKNANIIHTTTFNGGPCAWVVSKLKRKPLLITVHEVWVTRWRQLTNLNPISAFFHDLLERMIYWLNYDAYACVSKSTQQQLLERGVDAKKTHVVYNGLSYEIWNPKKYKRSEMRGKLGLKTFTIFFSGRPGVSKGLEYAINAFPQVLEKIPDAKFLLVLSKDTAYKKQHSQIMKLIENLAIKSNVILHEPVPYQDLPKYMIASDCVVIPSIAEGFGFSAAEASALGVPIVASNTTSLPEVVSNKFVLVKPKDPDDIARGILKVYEKKYTAKPLRKFTWKDNVNTYSEIYKSLLEN